MGPDCCCGAAVCCCDLDCNKTYYATLSAPSCSVLDARVIELECTQNGVGEDICQILIKKNIETIPNCTSATIPIQITLRCNKALAIRNNAGECDRYELEMYYNASPCVNRQGWVRVESGCTCSPLSLVFKMKSPKWNGIGVSDCDCCEDGDADITVTITE